MKTTKLLNLFNKEIKVWLQDLVDMDEEQLFINPAEKSWSLAEVYDHIMRVAREYQIPNMKKSLTADAERKKGKNKYGLAVFNLGIRKDIKMKMETFPQPLVEAFTPQKRDKAELLQDFREFIDEVNNLEELLDQSTKKDKQYHPMFGDINTKEWFALIELHIWQHKKQKKGILEFLNH